MGRETRIFPCANNHKLPIHFFSFSNLIDKLRAGNISLPLPLPFLLRNRNRRGGGSGERKVVASRSKQHLTAPGALWGGGGDGGRAEKRENMKSKTKYIQKQETTGKIGDSLFSSFLFSKDYRIFFPSIVYGDKIYFLTRQQ